MPDERQDSIRQGIGVPPETPIGAAAEEERRERAAHGPAIGGAMGGTSDSDRPGDEAQMDAARDGPRPEDEAFRRKAGKADPAAMYRDIPEDRVGG